MVQFKIKGFLYLCIRTNQGIQRSQSHCSVKYEVMFIFMYLDLSGYSEESVPWFS